jgi:hypothetical protein
MLAHFLQRRALAEAGYVRILAGILLAAPGVVGVGDAGDIFVGQLAVGAVSHAPELAGVDKEQMAAAVTELAFCQHPSS